MGRQSDCRPSEAKVAADGLGRSHGGCPITVVDLLVFYFTQFSAAIVTVIDVILLSWVTEHQRRSQIERLQPSP